MFDWFSFISEILLPALAKCHSETSSEDPQEFLQANFDAGTGKFEPSLVRSVIPATRRAVHQAWQKLDRRERKGFPRYSRADLYEMAEQNLHKALMAPPDQVAAIMKASETLPDGDD